MSGKHLLALVGSPRPTSTSENLARYLADGLAARGWQTDIQRITPVIQKPERWSTLEAQFLAADVIILCFPLYVDSLPAETTLALERLALARQAQPSRQPQRFLVVCNCGFFEASQNDVALAICRQFAKEAGLNWSGGLAIGAGGALGGRPLKELGGMARHIIASFDMVIDALHNDVDVPAEALTLVRQKAFPDWLYFLLANFGMYKGALDHGVLTKINAQPYLQRK